MIEPNICLLTDSYKLTHWVQYPSNTEVVYSYFESRGGVHPTTVFFGLQTILKKYLVGEVVTQDRIDEAEEFVSSHLSGDQFFNREGWEYIIDKYQGRLPVSIKAVPEGAVVPTHNVLMTIENTDPKLYWLPNYLETILVQSWYPTTVSTISREVKKIFKRYMLETGPSLDNLDFKLHDFGFRGVSSKESAGIGGLAHLVNFKGTDTLEGIRYGREYYHEHMAGFSIAASEHSTMVAWGKENEHLAMKNMLVQYPTGLVSCVSDSFDIYNACKNIWGTKLKDMVLSRNGTLVVRPDSGDVVDVPLNCLNILGTYFGTCSTPNRYNLLNPSVRVIQGDGMSLISIRSLLEAMKQSRWATDNMTVGMGGGLLQKLNRDTQKFAFKCSYVKVNGIGRDVWKDPVTDKGKISKKGRLKLIYNNGYHTVKEHYSSPHPVPDEFKHRFDDILLEVFRDGYLKKDWTLAGVRQRASV